MIESDLLGLELRLTNLDDKVRFAQHEYSRVLGQERMLSQLYQAGYRINVTHKMVDRSSKEVEVLFYSVVGPDPKIWIGSKGRNYLMWFEVVEFLGLGELECREILLLTEGRVV